MKNRTKIHELIKNWVPGAVYSVKWLKENGYSYSNLQIYKRSGWIKSLGAGAVIKNGDEVHWQGAVWALQEQLQLPVHVGSKTALEYGGAAQYIPLGRERVILIAEPKMKLPTWFKKTNWGADVIFHRSSLFDSDLQKLSDSEAGLKVVDFGRMQVTFSSRERAILEYLDQVPEKFSFSEAQELMENLISLRSKIVQNLLMHCTSVKAKRLFLALADRASHPWLKKLNLEQIDLGSGSRHLVGGGVFDGKYKITIGGSHE